MDGKMTTCCLCGRKMYMADTHNPWPVRPEVVWGECDEGRCCTACNKEIVYPVRRALDVTEANKGQIIKDLQNNSYEELLAIGANIRKEMNI